VKVFVGQILVALDTNHIKQYVFATDRLKDIRGASSILDQLNRRVMEDEANHLFHDKATTVYTNGGSGLFLIEGDEQAAEAFGRSVQKKYSQKTKGGASISFAVQKLPDNINPWADEKIRDYLELLNYCLIQKKETPAHITTLATHPLMRPCESCGVQYAEGKDRSEDEDPIDQDKRYCSVCLTKRKEDSNVKNGIKYLIKERAHLENVQSDSYIWQEVIRRLPLSYDIPGGTERPSDFNKLRGLAGGKDYLALIYADGNGMGKTISACPDLNAREQVAKRIDNAVYQALSAAIAKHMPVVQANGDSPPMFPFDILLIGGDDIVIVTPATYAMDVALTIAQQFHEYTKERDPEKKGHTLSVGVVLAPIKYPFGLLQDLAESTLKFAKQEGARQPRESAYGATRINFLVVAGSTSHDFKTVYAMLHNKHVRVSGQKDKATFYATLRPYTVEDLEALLKAIRAGKQRSLGRTKLHQVREAVLKMNLSTSVGDFLAVLRNWRQKQREFVTGSVYTLAGRYQEQHSSLDNPGSLFPRVTYPWFADGPTAYRTPLLDFVELYDFVAQEGGNGGEES
jgi:hypothetical protein